MTALPAPKRLLFLITKAELGGAQSHVADLIRGFAANYQIHLGVGSDGPLTEQARIAGAQVHFLPRMVRSINPFTDAASVRECLDLVRRVQPDLLHLHSSKAGIVGRLVGRKTGIPAVFTAHGWGFSPGVPRKRQFLALQVERALAPMAQKIICVSEFDRQLALRARVGNAKLLCTVRGGIELKAPDMPAGLAAEVAAQPPRFLMVARFSEQKDQNILLRAFAHIEEEAFVDLVGTGPLMGRTQELCRALKLENRVQFLGDRHDVAQLLQRAAGFVLSTHYEGLPISILEAMRAGLPVIATDVGGISEEVEQGQTGILVPRGDTKSLADALRALIRDPARRVQMGEAGKRKFEREFGVQKMLDGVEAVYREVWANAK